MMNTISTPNQVDPSAFTKSKVGFLSENNPAGEECLQLS